MDKSLLTKVKVELKSVIGESRQIAVEASLIFLVPLLLATIHFFAPSSIQSQLEFTHERFSVYTLLTSAYVHNSDTHLLGNITGYLIAVLYAYTLCLYADVRQWFRQSFAAILLIVPVLTALTSFAIISMQAPGATPTERGFSGVAAGFGGFLLVALGVYVGETYNRALGWDLGLAVLLLLLVEVDAIYGSGMQPLVVGLAIVGIVLMGVAYVREHGTELNGGEAGFLVPVGLTALVIIVLSYIILTLFPANPGAGGGFTNIYAHLAGFGYGALLSTFSRKSLVRLDRKN
jgi:hypothetical protein